MADDKGRVRGEDETPDTGGRIIPPKKRWNQQEGAGITTLTIRKT